jgi:hypothetical protein
MSKKINADDVLMQLSAGIIVPLTEKQWLKLEESFSIVDTIETGMSGQIQLLRRPLNKGKKLGWAFVEQPKDGQRVIRPFKSEKEARALIMDRLGAYERMWDG